MADLESADQTGAERSEAVAAPERTIAPEVDIEARAYRMGWRPKEQFKGPDGQWIPPDQFIERANENFPILRRTLRTMEDRSAKAERDAAELKAKLADLETTFSTYREFATKAETRAYNKARSELEAQREVAIAHADVAAVKTVEQQIKELDDTAKPPEPVVKPTVAAATERPTAQPDKPVIAPEIQTWMDANPWFNTDEELHAVAGAVHRVVQKAEPGLSMSDQLAKVKERVMQRYPEKFGNPRREAPSSVGASNGAGSKKKDPHSYENLPAPAKAACDKLVKQMAGHKKPFTREEYVANYEWADA